VKNNKYITYVLLLISTGIWCIVAYRIYSAIKDKEPAVCQTVIKPTKSVIKDSAVLLLNYRDPFSEEVTPEKINKEKKIPKKKIKVTPQKQLAVPLKVEVLPDFQYKGIIRFGKSVKAIANRNGETIILKPKEKIGEFLVAIITDEKMTVVRNGKKYGLLRQ